MYWIKKSWSKDLLEYCERQGFVCLSVRGVKDKTSILMQILPQKNLFSKVNYQFSGHVKLVQKRNFLRLVNKKRTQKEKSVLQSSINQKQKRLLFHPFFESLPKCLWKFSAILNFSLAQIRNYFYFSFTTKTTHNFDSLLQKHCFEYVYNSCRSEYF